MDGAVKRFNHESIKLYTRKLCQESFLPRVRQVEDGSLKRYKEKQSTINIFQLDSIPPLHTLHSWRSQLNHILELAVGYFYIESSLGRMDIVCVNNCIQLLEAKEIKRTVEKEIDWFNSSFLKPHSISDFPNLDSTILFKNLIHDKPCKLEVREDINITPEELSRLCGERYLAGDHMQWVAKALNQQNDQTLCIYLNEVSNIERFATKNMKANTHSLFFFINIGRVPETKRTFISSNQHKGCHWTMCSYDSKTKKCFYGDSLGWKVPEELGSKVKEYVNIFFGESSEIDIITCHAPNSEEHKCTNDCTSKYPLQTCFTVCGAVVIFMAVYFSLNRNFYDHLLSKTLCNSPTSFITHPTKYNKYIRRCIMTWMVEGFININNISPANDQRQEDVFSDSDNDENIIRLEIDIEIEPKQENIESASKVTSNRVYCTICCKSYTRAHDLKRHVISAHGEECLPPSQQSGKSICLSCGKRFIKIADLKQHLVEKHQFVLRNETLKFQSLSEFQEWKSSVEEAETCNFVLLKGEKIVKGQKVQYWQCNRSGLYRQKRKKRRRSKISGTSKIERNCTCTLKVVIGTDITAEICYTHYGHSKDLKHTWINRRAKQEIAAKLKQGVTSEKILDDVRENVGDSLTRTCLLERKDIQNICRAYGLNEIIRHNNDQMSVLSWIQSYQETDENPVLFYKLQGCKHDNPVFKEDDFMIIIQTQSQKNLLTKFGDNGICCDSTHKTTGYDFLLSTILVIDEFGKGQPVSHCLSNHETEEFLQIFFQVVKSNIGRNINPLWFMSDLAPTFYNAFCTINCCTPKWLYCIWHVDKAWQEEIRKNIKGSSTEETLVIQKNVYQMAKIVMECTNESEFTEKLKNFTDRLNTVETEGFKDYFIQNYVSCLRRWAYYYRVGDCINTNMFLESFHRHFKYKYLKGKYNKRVDVCLVNLVKHARDKLFGRLINLTKGASGYRLRLIQERHKTSTSMDVALVVAVDSDQSPEQYRVKSYQTCRLSKVCPVKECQLKCPECRICSHTFHCNCPDFMVNYLGCKHIHLLKRYLDNVGESGDNVESEVLPDLSQEDREAATVGDVGFFSNEDQYLENEVIDAFEHVRDPSNNFTNIKSKSIDILNSLVVKVQNSSLSDLNALEHLTRSLVSCSHTYDVMSKYEGVKKIPLTLKSPPNQNIEKQVSFYSTNKKRKKQSKIRFAKPTREDCKDFFSPKPWEKAEKKVKEEEEEEKKEEVAVANSISDKRTESDIEPERNTTITSDEVLESTNKVSKAKKKNVKEVKEEAGTNQVKTTTNGKRENNKKKKKTKSMVSKAKKKNVTPMKMVKLNKKMRKLLSFFGTVTKRQSMEEGAVSKVERDPPADIISYDSEDVMELKPLFSINAWREVLEKTLCVNELWTCSVCETPTHTDMIECENCEEWYHWDCVKDSDDHTLPSGTWDCSTCAKKS